MPEVSKKMLARIWQFAAIGAALLCVAACATVESPDGSAGERFSRDGEPVISWKDGFAKIVVEPRSGDLLVTFAHAGHRYACEIDGKPIGISAYGQELRVPSGKTLGLKARDASFTFTPDASRGGYRVRRTGRGRDGKPLPDRDSNIVQFSVLP